MFSRNPSVKWQASAHPIEVAEFAFAQTGLGLHGGIDGMTHTVGLCTEFPCYPSPIFRFDPFVVEPVFLKVQGTAKDDKGCHVWETREFQFYCAENAVGYGSRTTKPRGISTCVKQHFFWRHCPPSPLRAVWKPLVPARLPVQRQVPSFPTRPAATRLPARLLVGLGALQAAAFRACQDVDNARPTGLCPALPSLNLNSAPQGVFHLKRTIRAYRRGGPFCISRLGRN